MKVHIHQNLRDLFFVVLLGGLMYGAPVNAQEKQPTIEGRWSVDEVQDWYEKHEWLAGVNFIPSTAINPIEMWQEETFDPETIDRELGYAEDLGFNAIRVFLHYLVWVRSPEAMKERMDRFLEIADSHGIKTMFVMFDDVWGKDPNLGPQPEPVPGLHNSGWVQNPGHDQRLDTALYSVFEAYYKDIMNRFSEDDRVLLWDLYNEPGNGKNPPKSSLPLVKKVFSWGRDVNPSQPLAVAVWIWDQRYDELNAFQMANSDVITFNTYDPLPQAKEEVGRLEKLGRPMICTEYMARTRDSKFDPQMVYFKEQNIGAINWGLVKGKTNTIYSWQWPREASGDYWSQWHEQIRANYPQEKGEVPEPDVWFHDILRKDGSPYDSSEVELIKELTGRGN